MDISTSMEIGHILITIILLLLVGGIGSISFSLVFQPTTAVNSVYVSKRETAINTNNTKIKEPIIQDSLENYFAEDEPLEIETDGDLFDD